MSNFPRNNELPLYDRGDVILAIYNAVTQIVTAVESSGGGGGGGGGVNYALEGGGFLEQIAAVDFSTIDKQNEAIAQLVLIIDRLNSSLTRMDLTNSRIFRTNEILEIHDARLISLVSSNNAISAKTDSIFIRLGDISLVLADISGFLLNLNTKTTTMIDLTSIIRDSSLTIDAKLGNITTWVSEVVLPNFTSKVQKRYFRGTAGANITSLFTTAPASNIIINEYEVFNNSGATIFMKFFTASPTLGVTVPVFTIGIPPNSKSSYVSTQKLYQLSTFTPFVAFTQNGNDLDTAVVGANVIFGAISTKISN